MDKLNLWWGESFSLIIMAERLISTKGLVYFQIFIYIILNIYLLSVKVNKIY